MMHELGESIQCMKKSSSTIHDNPNRHYGKSVHIGITIPHLNEGEKSDGDMKMQRESTCNVAKKW